MRNTRLNNIIGIVMLLGVEFAFGGIPEAFPTAYELISKRAELQPKIESFCTKYQVISKYNYPSRKWSGEMYHSFDIRYDGLRSKSIELVWGKVSQINPDVKEDEAEYSSRLWDNEKAYYYGRGTSSDPGMVIISDRDDPGVDPAKMNLAKGSCPGQILGYQRGDNDKIEDLMLNRSSNLEVRKEMQSIRGNKCYVIDAVVKNKGTYTLWIDPEHDYHITRVQVQRKAGDYIYQNQLRESDLSNEVFEVLEYKKNGEVWYPNKCRYTLKGKGFGHPYKEERIVTFTEVILNPDHEKLRSFKPDDIPNGTPTKLRALPSNLNFIWQDGEAIPDIGQSAIDAIDRMAEEVLAERAGRKAGAANNPSAFELLDKFVESQKKLKSYIIKSNTKATFSYTGFNKNRPGTTYRHSDVRFDGDRVKESLTHWGDQGHRILDLPKENAEYTSCLWDGETGYGLSLVQKNRRQTAKHPGLVQIYKKGSRYADYAKETYKRTMISPAQGYVMGNDQDIGTMFLRADAKVKLLDKRSKVNGVDCYVIEAEVPKGGKYKVWIDPVHDFNLARLQSRRKTGDLYYGRPLNEDVHWNNFYEVVEFQEVKGVWLPKTFKTKANGHDGGYDFDHQEETQTELYEVNLDPDHHKEGSFLTDDILNGTQVRLEGRPLNVILTWQDGEVVPEIDDSAIDQLDKMTAEILAEGKKRKVSLGKAVANDSVTLSRILAEYAKSQKQIASFYCVSSTAAKDQKAVLSRYACDGSRFSVKVKAGAQGVDGFVWDGKHSIHSSGGSGRSKKVLASADKKKPYQLLATVYPGAALLGYLNGQPERIDSLLSKVSKEATVTEGKLNGKSCYVVNAQIGKDTYWVWFLPANGYHIARAEVKAGSKVVYLLDQVQIKKVEDRWVPMSCSVKDPTQQYNYKRTKIDLKPDFKKLKAFDLPISNGTPVTIENKSGKFVWLNGHVVNKEGKDVL